MFSSMKSQAFLKTKLLSKYVFNFGPRIELGKEGGKGALISNVVIIVVGIGLIFFGYNTYTSQNQALENPVNVSATVTETGIAEDSSRRGGIDYQPQIKYEYRFEGETYTSENMYPGGQKPDEHNIESEARELVEEYSQGSEISILVPPEKPGEAFIQPEKTNDPLIFIAIGILFAGMGVYRFSKDKYK
jgi:hypothetical protein